MSVSRSEAFFLREWQRNSPWQILLRPLSWGFGLLSALRRALYRSGALTVRRVRAPVIVVGNICVGGTGKTPLVMAITHWLQKKGYRPGLVARGYGSTATAEGGIHKVEVEADDSAARWGDEPVLLVRRLGCPMYVGADRAAAAATLLANHPEVNVIVSDDGLQHYGLYRDIEVALVDGSRGFGNGALLPAGPLREPVSRLFSVTAVIANGTGRRFKKDMPSLLSMHLGGERFIHLLSGRALGLDGFREVVAGKTLHALAGIGNPQRFFSNLHRHGLVTTDHPLPDHHAFRGADIDYPGVVLMTEKDAVKCRSWADERHWYMRIDAQLPDNFFLTLEARLKDWVPHASRRRHSEAGKKGNK